MLYDESFIVSEDLEVFIYMVCVVRCNIDRVPLRSVLLSSYIFPLEHSAFFKIAQYLRSPHLVSDTLF